MVEVLKTIAMSTVFGLLGGWATYMLLREYRRWVGLRRLHKEISRERDMLRAHVGGFQGKRHPESLKERLGFHEETFLVMLPPFQVRQYETLEENRERMHEHIMEYWGVLPDPNSEEWIILENTLEAAYQDASIMQFQEDLKHIQGPEDIE